VTCASSGGRYRVTHDYDYDGTPITREHWETCYSCSGQGTRLCWRCGGTGEIASLDLSRDTDVSETSAAHSSISPRDRRDDFNQTKHNVLALLLECNPLGERRWSLRNELQAIQIDTPDAVEKLSAIEEEIANHSAYSELNTLRSIRWDINWLMMRAKYQT